MVTTVAFDDKVHHFYINDQEMCRIYQNIEDVQKVNLHVGYVLDGNGDPSARTREHVNTILATLAEDIGFRKSDFIGTTSRDTFYLALATQMDLGAIQQQVHKNGIHS